ncbi:MAG: iron-containing alcohol dehydrogenase [Gammaproteobacteria bacterium AqS3]|nr:iron-containing alcohol dehydrogenase [Gammaproteobacteria bacterium AqS3]
MGNLILPRTEMICHGPNIVQQQLPEVLLQHGLSRAFLLTTPSLVRNGIAEQVERALGAAHAGSFGESVAHTPRDVVLRAARAVSQADVDALICLGGSSVVDLTKGVAMVVAEGADFESMRIRYRPGEVPVIPRLGQPKLPILAIPTTLSASEYTAGIGITDRQTGEKHGYVDAKVVPKVVFHDSVICSQTPDALWAATGMKILSDCLEMIVSNRAGRFTDLYAFEAATILTEGLPASVQGAHGDAGRLDSRERLLYAAYLSLSVVLNSSLGLVAAIRHQLGGAHGVGHGEASAIVLPHVMRWNAPAASAGYARIARSLRLDAQDDDTAATEELIRHIEGLIEQLGIPGTLEAVGIGGDDFAGIAEHVCSDMSIANNPRPVKSPDDVIEVLQTALK